MNFFKVKNKEKIKKMEINLEKLENLMQTHSYYDESWTFDLEKKVKQNVAILLWDLDCPVTLKVIQNVLKKDNPKGEKESIIQNLHQFLFNCCFSQKKINYHFEKNFDQIEKFFNFHFNQIKSEYNWQKIALFWEKAMKMLKHVEDFQPLLKMQFLHIYTLINFPEKNKKDFISKILAVIWYFLNNVFEEKNQKKVLFLTSYLEVFRLNDNYYQKIIEKISKNQSYGIFLDFTTKNILEYEKNQIINELIIKFWTNNGKHFFLIRTEKKFLFIIIHFQLDQFDWRIFKKKSKNVSSKQHIIKNLTQLEKYQFLTSKMWKNRKFFYQTSSFKKKINFYQKELH